ncbi:MAG: glycosyltransferase family 1 protein [Nitrospiraceae bacterium]
MRIGIDARLGLRSGVGRYTRELIDAASAYAPEHTFVLFVKPRDLDVLTALYKGRSNIEWRAIPGTPFLLGEHLSLSYEVTRARLDLLHITFDYGMPLLAPTPTVLTVHDAWFEAETFFRSRWTKLYFQTMTKRGIRKATRIITVSEFVKGKILTFCPWMRARAEDILVVPNGVGEEFSPLNGAQQGQDRPAARDPYILSVGVLAAIKNIMGLLDAYAYLRRIMPAAPRLVVAGKRDSSFPDPLPRVRELGLESYVTLPGYVSDQALPELYRRAALFVLPSFHEGFGIPVIEAMASGVPVVASNRGGLPEVAAGSARLVNPLDPEDMAQGMKAVLCDAAASRLMVEAGLCRAKQFSWKTSARRTLDVYAEVGG